MDQIGSYYISPIVYDPADLDITAINYGTVDVFTSNVYLFGLGVCGHFNLSGIEFQVEEYCQQELYIPGIGIGVKGGLYEVSQTTTSDGGLSLGNVDFSAEIEIELMSEFEVELEIEFHAYIEGCN